MKTKPAKQPDDMSEEHYLLLLLKSENETLQAGDARDLEQWLQDPAHARRAGEYRAIWNSSAGYQTDVRIDAAADFQRILDRIGQKPALRSYRGGVRVWMRAAAALLVLLAAYGMFRVLRPAQAALETVTADAGATKVVLLPDGSTVWLRQNSSLQYPRSFSAGERRVQLDGEAYFAVEPAPEKPFHVGIAGGGDVTVLGTRFGIRNTGSSTVILVRSGKVRYRVPQSPKTLDLTAGRRAEYDAAARRVKVSDALSFNELSWQTGGLEFIRTPMHRVVEDLSAYYRVRVELRNAALEDCTFTSPLTRQSIAQVLNSISLTYGLRVEQPAPGAYILSGGACPE